MRAVLYDAPRSFSVTDIPMPEPGPGEVRIRVTRSASAAPTCTSTTASSARVFPLIPGHELVGIVDALGDGVDRFPLGEQVTVNPNIHCGMCDYCLSGRTILCENAKGLGANSPGFFAEFVTVPSGWSSPSMDSHWTPPCSPSRPRARCTAGDPAPAAGLTARWSSAPAPPGMLLAQLFAIGGASAVTVAAPEPVQARLAAALGIDQTVLIDRSDPQGNVDRAPGALPAAPATTSSSRRPAPRRSATSACR